MTFEAYLDMRRAEVETALDRFSPTAPTVPAVIANAMAGDRDKALEAGCDEYESKPINFPALFEKIDAILARQSGNPPPAAA